MRVVPKSQPSEEDNSQKLWWFSPSFIHIPAEEEEEEEKPSPLPPPPLARGKKRPRDASKKSRKRAERKWETKKIKDIKAEGSTSGRAARGSASSSERWTADRYERAELKVIDVMRGKAAELGNRIERKELREEARKHIGDTGLLDHLLKHMAGKVVGDRGERFMRGYNVEGVMQYWLEPAELEESRRKGELGDVCRCGTECKEEIGLLRERIGVLNRDLEELRSLKELEKSVWKENYEKLLKRNIKLETEMEGMNSSFQGLKENYERLLKRNIKLETQMAGMNSSFQGLKDEMLLLREEKSKDEEDKRAVEVEMIEDAKGGSDSGVGDKKNENKQLHKHELSMSPKASLCSPQLRRPYIQLPCRGRVYVNCLNGSQKSLGHLSQLSPPIESDQSPCGQIPNGQSRDIDWPKHTAVEEPV